MITKGWRQIQFHDRGIHFFPASDNALVKAKCGMSINVKFTHEPHPNISDLSCKACLQAGAPGR